MEKKNSDPFKFLGLGLIIFSILLLMLIVFMFVNTQDNSNLKLNQNLDKNINDGKVIIEVYSDFECPFCTRFYLGAYADIKKEYVDAGLVQLSYKHFPLTSHPNARIAAMAYECARDEGKEELMHDIIFEKGNPTRDNLNEYAKELSLNINNFNDCMNSNKYDAKVTQDLNDGIDKGVSGTPTIFINDVKIVGARPFSDFKKVIDEKLLE